MNALVAVLKQSQALVHIEVWSNLAVLSKLHSKLMPHFIAGMICFLLDLYGFMIPLC